MSSPSTETLHRRAASTISISEVLDESGRLSTRQDERFGSMSNWTVNVLHEAHTTLLCQQFAFFLSLIAVCCAECEIPASH